MSTNISAGSLAKTVMLFLLFAIACPALRAQPEYDRANYDRARINSENAARDKQNAENNRPFEKNWGSAEGVFNRSATSSGSSAHKGWNSEQEHLDWLAKEKREQDARIELIMNLSSG